MKDCKKIHPLLSLHLEGALSQKEKALVERHLATCITARREREQFEKMRKAFLDQPDPEPPSDLHERIMSHVGLAAEAAKVIPWKRPFLLAAAMLMVVLFLDRLPEWKKDALRPDPEGNFAAQQPPAPMERAAAPRSEGLTKESSYRNEGSKKTGSRAAKKTALGKAAATGPSHQKSDMGQDDAAAGLSAPARDRAELPTSSMASEAMAPAPASRAEAERDLNTLTLSKKVSALHWRGDNAPQEGAQERLLADPDSFRTTWQALRPGQKEPAIDFERDSVIYLTAGTRPTAGYSILIVGLQDREDSFAVLYRVQPPAADALAAQVVTHPWVLQAVPKPSKPVVFIQE